MNFLHIVCGLMLFVSVGSDIANISIISWLRKGYRINAIVGTQILYVAILFLPITNIFARVLLFLTLMVGSICLYIYCARMANANFLSENGKDIEPPKN